MQCEFAVRDPADGAMRCHGCRWHACDCPCRVREYARYLRERGYVL